MFSPVRATLAPAATFLRSFSTTRPALDLAKVSLIGRLGSDPVKRETAAGKPYYIYSIATNTGPQKVDSEGKHIGQMTNWHSVFAFSEGSHNTLSNVGKGSTVYVEADLEMRASEPLSDGTQPPDRPLLRHRSMAVINRVRPPTEEEGQQQDD